MIFYVKSEIFSPKSVDIKRSGKDVTWLEDRKIIELFYQRSEQAIIELSRKYSPAIRKTAGNILKDLQDIEECENDTYLGVWNTVPPQKPNPLISYVCRIARNLSVKKYHSSTAKKRNSNYDLVLDELEECIPSSIDVESEYAAKEISRAISRFLETLSYDDRFCFVRRYWYADSVAEIAAMIHTDSRKISVRLFRIRTRLHNYLKEEGLIE